MKTVKKTQDVAVTGVKGDFIVVRSREKTTAKGVHIFTICDARSERAQHLQWHCEDVGRRREDILRYRDFLVGGALVRGECKSVLDSLRLSAKNKLHDLWLEYRFYVETLHKTFKIREKVIENVTTTVGRGVLAQRLGGDVTFTGTVNYTALGDDNTAPVIADATLGNEVFRKLLSSGTDSNNIAYLETFFSSTDVNGTFEEYGNFIDGTGSIDTGQLFNRFTSSITKSNLETLNVQSIITFSDA